MIVEFLLHPQEDRFVRYQLPSGLTLEILPKQGFTRYDVSLTVRFGSIDAEVTLQDGTTKTFRPGIAHFLEHMIFENEDVDVSRAFSLKSASVNAYTTTNRTVYYFSTTAKLDTLIPMLLEMVLSPKFAIDSFEKERRIIQSEIEMYDDEIDQRMYYDLMSLLFENHPIRHDIAGSKEDVSMVTLEEIEEAYSTFYHPSNMTLLVSGDVDVDQIYQEVRSLDSTLSFSKVARSQRVDVIPQSSMTREIQRVKDLSQAEVMIGIPLPVQVGQPLPNALDEIRWLLLLDQFFSPASKNNRQLFQSHLVNNTFDYSTTLDETYGYAIFYFQTRSVKKAISTIKAMLEEMKKSKVDGDLLETQKRKLFGQYVQAFNSPAEAAHLIAEQSFRGVAWNDLMEGLKAIHKDELDQLAKTLSIDAMRIVTYRPKTR